MRSKEIVREGYREYKTATVNVNASVKPERGYFSQNINTISIDGGDDANKLMWEIYALDKSVREQAVQEFADAVAAGDAEVNQTLLDLTDAYYNTAYAVVADAMSRSASTAQAIIAKYQTTGPKA